MKTKDVILRDSLPKDCIWDESHNAVGEWKLVNTPSEHVRRAMGEYAKHCLQQAVERIEIKIDNANTSFKGAPPEYIAGLNSGLSSIRQLLKELE